MTPSDPFAQLCDAIALFQAWRQEANGQSLEDLCCAHPDLRELLESLAGEAKSLGEEATEPTLDPEDPQGHPDQGHPHQGYPDGYPDSGYGNPRTTPRRFGRGDFEQVREIGRGGMGVVYEATQRTLDRTVALKVLAPHPALHPRAITRFRREAAIAARLRHPGLAEVYAISDPDDEIHWYAMEFVRGASLDTVLAAVSQGGLGHEDGRAVEDTVLEHCLTPRSEAARKSTTREGSGFWNTSAIGVFAAFAEQVALALQCAHEAGIVHRDVKPSNILVQPNGRAVLTDFGLSLEDTAPLVSIEGTFCGTPGYSSPEQIEGTRDLIDHRTDIFSLGVTLYEMLTGERPYARGSTQDELKRAIRIEPTRPDRVRSRVPQDLSAIVMRCLEKDPTRRYPSAAALAHDLRSFLSFEPVQARHVRLPGRLIRWAKREPARAALATVLTLGVGASVGVWAYVERQAALIERGAEAMRTERLESALTGGFHALITQGDAGTAEASFLEALALDRHNPTALAGLLLTDIRRRDPEHARSRLHSGAIPSGLLADTPGLRRLQTRIERLADRTVPTVQPVEPADALDCLVAGLLEYEDAVYGTRVAHGGQAFRFLDRACQMFPVQRRYALCLRAETAAWAADPSLALDAERVLAQLWPDDPDVRLTRARTLADLDDQRALEILTPLLSERDVSGHAHRSAASIWLQRGEFERAKTLLEIAVARNPTSADIQTAYGNVLSKLGEHDLAVRANRRATEQYPAGAVFWFNLGVCERESGNVAGAIAAFSEAAELDPLDAEAANELSRLEHQCGHLDRAIAARRESIRRAPDVRSYRNDLAVLLIENDQPDAAVEAFRALLEVAPEDVAARRNYGLCLHDIGDHNAAYAELRRCIADAPDWRDGYTALSGLLMLDGRLLEAAEVGQQLLAQRKKSKKASSR